MKIIYVDDESPASETAPNIFIEKYIDTAIKLIPENLRSPDSIYYAVVVPKWVDYGEEIKYYKHIETLLSYLHGDDFKLVHIIGYRDIHDERDLQRGLNWLKTVKYYDRVFDFKNDLVK